jgi:hypothetical protein
MKRLCMLVLGTWALVAAQPAHAQIFGFFKKSPPPLPPAQRVAALITTVKSETDERKRVNAVEELREFDTKSFPEIVPVLVDAAKSDSKASVRSEAVNSLVRIRPISTIAGQAIEHAAQHDDNWRNRMSAQAALMRYRLAGYSSPPPTPQPPQPPTPQAKGPAGKQPAQTSEPPLNDPPQILYYDQNGNRIPAPKELKGPIIKAPTPAVPTSNPKKTPTATFIPPPAASTGEPPLATPMVTSPPAALAPNLAPSFGPPTIAPPTSQGPVLAPSVTAPPITGPSLVPAPMLAPPTSTGPAVTEPTFRPVDRATVNRINPPINPQRAPVAPPTSGPSLDLPPMPITGTPSIPSAGPNLTPAPLVPPTGTSSGPAPF